MARDAFDALDPTDPHNADDPPGVDLPPNAFLQRHPYVRSLLREIARLRERTDQVTALQRDMTNRDLVAARYLEPLNPAPIGIIEPRDNLPTYIHVDNLRVLRNRVMQTEEPTIRVIPGGLGGTPVHCRRLRLLGPSELREHYRQPLPNRPSAVIVLETLHAVEVLL